MDRSGGYEEYAFVAEFYDYVVPYRDRQDVAFFVEMAQHSPEPVLEIGCGTGRVLIPIARAGLEIVGLDLSPSMLSVCRQKLLGEPAEVQAKAQLVRGDMRQFELGREFGLAIIPFRPFQHLLTVEDQVSCLTTTHRQLVGGGRLILDLFNPSLPLLASEQYGVEWGEEPAFMMPGGRRVVRRHRTLSRDLFQQIQDEELIYQVTYPNGCEERLVHRFQMRYLFRFEAEHLLARCGLRVEEIYADYDKSPYGSQYPGELIFVARKE
jgi:SAM-dependent methyltransferase